MNTSTDCKIIVEITEPHSRKVISLDSVLNETLQILRPFHEGRIIHEGRIMFTRTKVISLSQDLAEFRIWSTPFRSAVELGNSAEGLVASFRSDPEAIDELVSRLAFLKNYVEWKLAQNESSPVRMWAGLNRLF